jgi:hypothetical protein
MKQPDEILLTNAIQELRNDQPNSAEISASALHVANRLGIAEFNVAAGESAIHAIGNCDDVQQLLSSYRAGTLPPSRSLLVEAHLRDCRACMRRSRTGSEASVLDWSAPKQPRAIAWRPQVFGWPLAACVAFLLFGSLIYRAYWQVPPGVRAEVRSVDGPAYLTTGNGDHALSPGDKLSEGDQLRTGGGAHAVLQLADGSTVELNERSVVAVGARGKNMTVSLNGGAVIVQAAKRTSGHLYVKTPDCRVAVTGTIFSVDSGIKGSRVAVLRGSVEVAHAGVDSLLHAGDQISTSDNLSPAPIEQQIAWSQDRVQYLGLVAQFAVLEHRIGDIPFPQPRYTSDLLPRVPADTLLYVSVPNLGDFLAQANSIFHDQLKQSPELQQWWAKGGTADTEQLDAMVDKLHSVSQYLGDEIVIVSLKQEGVRQDHNSGFALVADVQKSGLDALLKEQFPASSPDGGLTVLDEQSLAAAPTTTKEEHGGYALIRQHEAIFSNSVATLKAVNAQFNAGASGFASGEFGRQIAAAYGRGAGIILAADLHQMLASDNNLQHSSNDELEKTGLSGVQYLIAEHREADGVPANHLTLQFSGTRQRVASWLAAPAPIGSLDFVTPNAAVAVAVLSKDPKAIADDIMAMAEPDDEKRTASWSEADQKLQIDIRNDLAANLSGDFLLSLDGPVLPTPSWKMVIAVNDSSRLEQALERLTQSIREDSNGKNLPLVTIESSENDGQRFYAVHDLKTGTTPAQYTFSEGYMIVAPNRPLLLEALQTRASGNSLSHSAAFKALLPKDDNDNYSAVAYQNLSPVLTPLLSQLSGPSADAIRKLAADSRPTAICAWGKDARIEAASDSRLFGFDFLTLGTLLNSGNKPAARSVKE